MFKYVVEVRKKLGDNTNPLLKNCINGKVIPSDSKRIREINKELEEKCRKQRENDAEAAVWARDNGCC